MKTLLAGMLAAAFAALPLAASADTSPLVNRVIVDQALQQQMQNQLNTQQTQLQTQRDLTRANLQSQMQQQQLQMQYLLLQQQIELLKIQQRATAHPAAAHRGHCSARRTAISTALPCARPKAHK
ncbi:MAG TPA: hypothetical protein VFH72_14640 [Candidatus Baltobacteraceae bacterium]|nr:hypothetical protein [Candidatus Baltobacteraceae bacterium]